MGDRALLKGDLMVSVFKYLVYEP